MTSEWRTVAIGSLCSGIYDGPHATPSKTDKGPVFLGISSLEDGRLNLSDTEHLSEEDYVRWTRRVEPSAGDIVFSYETRLGQAAMIPPGLRCCLGRRLALMRVDPTKADARFLLYAYLGPDFQETLKQRTIPGSTVNRLPLIDFPMFPIRVPPLETQRAIASILSALDDKIELNRRMNRTLEGLSQTLFRSWFVDLDPVRANREGRRLEGLSAEAQAGFPADFEGEGEAVPMGWRLELLGDLIELAYGKPLKGDTRRSGDVPVFGSNGQVGWHDEALVPGPGIIVGRKGNPGTVEPSRNRA